MRPGFGTLDLAAIRAVVMDMDGVLWLDDLPLPGLVAFFALLESLRLPFVLATNNASRTSQYYVEKLARFGVAVDLQQVLTSSMATADYLRPRFPAGTPVYVIGQAGLRESMTDAGFRLVEDVSEPVAVVVQGVDFSLTYDKLKSAAIHIQRGAHFVSTNADASYPSPEGLLPGSGSILAALQTATGTQAIVIGKPEAPMFELALARLGRPAHCTLMLGDRLDTDIDGGRRAGLKTILVTTGVNGPEAAAAADHPPDATFSGLEALTAAWIEAVAGAR